MQKKYKPKHKLTCNLCKSVVLSLSSGRMTYCKCRSVAIDETAHYCNISGDKDNVTVDVLSTEDYRKFYWRDIEGKQTMIKDLDPEHLLNIAVFFEQIPENRRDYYNDIILEEVIIRKLDNELIEKRVQNEIIRGSYGPITNTMSHFSNEHLLSVILYIEEIGVDKNEYHYTLAMNELEERALEKLLVLERLKRKN